MWKTTDGGVVWTPLFDAMPSPSIGAIAVAPSNHNIVYVGTGHNLLGNGVYRSSDAGATWQHAGLDDTKFITALLVDPHDPDVVLAGVGAGGNFGSMVYYNNNPSAARGVYRTTDGGRTWTHTLIVDPGASVIDLVADPTDPDVVFVSVGGARGGRAAIYRSADNGVTWARVSGAGLAAGVASANIAVARHGQSPTLRPRRRSRWRRVSIGRWRRAWTEHDADRERVGPSLCRSRKSRRRLHDGHVDVPLHRRRPDVGGR